MALKLPKDSESIAKKALGGGIFDFIGNLLAGASGVEAAAEGVAPGVKLGIVPLAPKALGAGVADAPLAAIATQSPYRQEFRKLSSQFPYRKGSTSLAGAMAKDSKLIDRRMSRALGPEEYGAMKDRLGKIGSGSAPASSDVPPEFMYRPHQYIPTQEELDMLDMMESRIMNYRGGK